MQQMSNIQQGFNQQSLDEIIEKFQDLLQNVLYLSSASVPALVTAQLWIPVVATA